MDSPKTRIATRYPGPDADTSIAEIRGCSRCRTRLGVPEEMLGMMHTCPACDYVFRAISAHPFGHKRPSELRATVEEEIVALRPAEIDAV